MESMTRNNLILLACIVVLGAAYIGYQYFSTPPTETASVVGAVPEGAHVITLTKEGFVPAELTVKNGETVTFNTTTGSLFWPASNLHPSHLVYSEFDPKEPVQPDASWSFTFTKPGEWEFHDHLAPYFTGVITVTE